MDQLQAIIKDESPQTNYDNLLNYNKVLGNENEKLKIENENLKRDLTNLREISQQDKQRLSQSEYNLQQKVDQISKLEGVIQEKNEQNQKLDNDIKLTEQKIGQQLANFLVIKKDLEQEKKDKDVQIIKLKNNLQEIEKELWKLKSIQLNEQLQSNKRVQQDQYLSQIRIQNNNSMDIEGQNLAMNLKLPNNNDKKNLTIEYYILQNKQLSKDYQSLLSKQRNFDELSNQIIQQQNLINEKNEIIQNIKNIANNQNQTYQQNTLFLELKKILESNQTKNYVKKYFKCCGGQNELVHCKQMSCIYHLNCLYPTLIKQGELELNNCDCGQTFPYSILRKVNYVEAKCLLDQILERQLQKLISQMRNDQRFLLYKCPNLFCNFQWCFRPDNSSSNQGSLSYCPNCQINIYSEIKLN